MSLGKKYDGGKVRYDLVPHKSYRYWAEVLTFGASKYGDNNWKELDNLQNRYYSAAVRHIEAHRRGELLDDESNLPHLSHAIATLSFLLEDSLTEGGKDVRTIGKLGNGTRPGASSEYNVMDSILRGVSNRGSIAKLIKVQQEAYEDNYKEARAKANKSN